VNINYKIGKGKKKKSVEVAVTARGECNLDDWEKNGGGKKFKRGPGVVTVLFQKTQNRVKRTSKTPNQRKGRKTSRELKKGR